MTKIPLSVVILARNEENNLEDCIKSCGFAEDVLVINNGSTDRTVEIAKSLGARVLNRDMNGDFGAQKTFGVENALCPWVLILDADERITDSLASSIIKAVNLGDKAAYKIQRENHFESGVPKHGAMRPDWVLRLAPKDKLKIVGVVHEKFVTPYPVKKLSGRMVHFTYRSLSHHLQKIDAYTTLAAYKYYQNGRRCLFCRDVVLKPFFAFFKVYVINLGFLDGKLGFLFSVNHYFYNVMKFAKLYFLEKHQGKL